MFIKFFTPIHLVSRLKVSECTMEHTHRWDREEGKGKSWEGHSRRSTQNRRDPGGWASRYRRPRSNRKNCCQVHLSPFIVVNPPLLYRSCNHVQWQDRPFLEQQMFLDYQLKSQKFLPKWIRIAGAFVIHCKKIWSRIYLKKPC